MTSFGAVIKFKYALTLNALYSATPLMKSIEVCLPCFSYPEELTRDPEIIPDRVQLQQPGNQSEGMGGVSESQCSLSLIFLDCIFISNLRFSFILLQKH